MQKVQSCDTIAFFSSCSIVLVNFLYVFIVTSKYFNIWRLNSEDITVLVIWMLVIWSHLPGLMSGLKWLSKHHTYRIHTLTNWNSDLLDLLRDKWRMLTHSSGKQNSYPVSDWLGNRVSDNRYNYTNSFDPLFFARKHEHKHFSFS